MARAEAATGGGRDPQQAVQGGLIALCVLLLAGACWLWLYQQSVQMQAASAMAAMPGMAPPQAPRFWSYVPGNTIMWLLMMTAMMLPSITPTMLLYGRLARAGGGAFRSTLTMAGAYLGVWAGFSMVAALVQFVLVRFGVASGASLAIGDRRIVGALMVLAGLYQFARLKGVCLDSCRSPLSFIMRLWRPGWRGALAIGVHHGVYCLGCCWLLMALLFVGGVMNLAWIVALAFLVLLEKTAPYGHRIGQAAGLAALAWGVVLLLSPAMLR